MPIVSYTSLAMVKTIFYILNSQTVVQIFQVLIVLFNLGSNFVGEGIQQSSCYGHRQKV